MKKYYLLFLLILLTALGGCQEETTLPTTLPVTTASTTTLLALEAPGNLVLADRTLSWGEVPGANEYIVRIDGRETNVSTNSYLIPESVYGKLSISVKAKAGTVESPFSNPILRTIYYVLSQPENIAQNGTLITWDEVLCASGYVIKVNGVEIVLEDNEYNIDIATSKTINVRAICPSDSYIINSDFTVDFVTKTRLQTPSGIRYEEGRLVWDAVANADGYRLTIGASSYQVAINVFTDVSAYRGEETVTVTAKNTLGLYLDSIAASAIIDFPIQRLPKVTGIEVSGNNLRFEGSAGATVYDIYYGGNYFATITETTYLIPPSIMADPDSYLQVVAKADGFHDSPLSEKVFVNYELISTEAELIAMTAGGHYVLANDIALTAPWIPLDFSGSLNGNDFEISNIVISDAYQNTGLFGVLNEATITNLNLNGDINFISGLFAVNVGSLAGTITSSEIANVSARFTINAASHNGVGTVGGLVGLLENTNLYRSHFAGEITTANMTTGGLIGKAQNPLASSSVHQSSVTAAIFSSGGLESPAGGFIGVMNNNYLSISEAMARVEVVGANTVGGFVGRLDFGHISDSYAIGTVEATNTEFVSLGGFIGMLVGYNATVVNILSAVDVVDPLGNIEVYAGGFTGLTPGGSYALMYDNCHYQSLANPIDRIGNAETGRGDGIALLVGLEDISGFSPSIWDFGTFFKLVWEKEAD
ncbi:MAG: GLUG motif-containing protein [Candidatus Izemoplasmatales bacterium]